MLLDTPLAATIRSSPETTDTDVEADADAVIANPAVATIAATAGHFVKKRIFDPFR